MIRKADLAVDKSTYNYHHWGNEWFKILLMQRFVCLYSPRYSSLTITDGRKSRTWTPDDIPSFKVGGSRMAPCAALVADDGERLYMGMIPAAFVSGQLPSTIVFYSIEVKEDLTPVLDESLGVIPFETNDAVLEYFDGYLLCSADRLFAIRLSGCDRQIPTHRVEEPQ
jgi:hypothetical protein